MQAVWASGIEWDEILRDEEFSKWKSWLHEIEKVKSCRFPRCYQTREFQVNSAELHIFCDASEKAYTAVAYWRFLLPDTHNVKKSRRAFEALPLFHV